MSLDDTRWWRPEKINDLRSTVRRRFKQAGLGQKETARMCGIDQSSFCNYLNRRTDPKSGKERQIGLAGFERLLDLLDLEVVPVTREGRMSHELIRELRTQIRMGMQAHDEGCDDEVRKRLDKSMGIVESILLKDDEEETDASNL